MLTSVNWWIAKTQPMKLSFQVFSRQLNGVETLMLGVLPNTTQSIEATPFFAKKLDETSFRLISASSKARSKRSRRSSGTRAEDPAHHKRHLVSDFQSDRLVLSWRFELLHFSVRNSIDKCSSRWWSSIAIAKHCNNTIVSAGSATIRIRSDAICWCNDGKHGKFTGKMISPVWPYCNTIALG